MVPKEIVTPEKVRKLRRTLYRNAKRNKQWRVWSLYGDLCRLDVLHLAAEQVIANRGAAGIDGMTVEAVKPLSARMPFIEQLREELVQKRYRASAVLRVKIPKGNGKLRCLGIPTVRDRVVQAALRLLLEPVFEADMHAESYGYRPGKSAHQAIDSIKDALWDGKTEVVDADLSQYFDRIPHAPLLACVKRRVSDGGVLALIGGFLKAPVSEDGVLKGNSRGTPQGGVLSPLLANLYLNGLDHQVNGKAGAGAHMVRYADDLVILCQKGQGAALLERLRQYLGRKGLVLNDEKTRLVDFTREGFAFLGFQFQRRQSDRTQRWYPHVEPTRKAQKRFRDAVRGELNHWSRWKPALAVVARVNVIARGWVNYFHHGNSNRVFRRLNLWLFKRLANWLWHKHKRKLSKQSFFTYQRLHGQYKLFEFPQAVSRA